MGISNTLQRVGFTSELYRFYCALQSVDLQVKNTCKGGKLQVFQQRKKMAQEKKQQPLIQPSIYQQAGKAGACCKVVKLIKGILHLISPANVLRINSRNVQISPLVIFFTAK